MTEEAVEYRVESIIFTVRGQKVILDSDLARLYGVKTKNLNKAMARNQSRFPEDFAFQLTAEEHSNLRFQSGTSSVYRVDTKCEDPPLAPPAGRPAPQGGGIQRSGAPGDLPGPETAIRPWPFGVM